MADFDRILIDTSAIYALRSEDDRFHHEANFIFNRLKDENPQFFVTSYTLVETIALLHRRLGFQVVSEFSEWREANLRVVWVDNPMHAAAWERYMAEQGRGLSFVDWTIVVASRDMGAPIFTFDSDFAIQGLPVVPPSLSRP